MISISCDDKQDIYLGSDGNLSISADLAAVIQNCRTAMQAQLGEMIYRATSGMPTKATAFDGLNAPQFEAAARGIIKGVEGVTGVESFSVNKVSDTVVYTADISTIYGKAAVTNG